MVYPLADLNDLAADFRCLNSYVDALEEELKSNRDELRETQEELRGALVMLAEVRSERDQLRTEARAGREMDLLTLKHGYTDIATEAYPC